MSDTKRLALDIGLLAALLLAMVPGFRGTLAHEWIGFALVLPALFHLVVNWDWVVRVIDQLFDKARNASRLNLLVDTLLFVSFIAVSLSGVMIMPSVRDALSGDTAYAWYSVHSFSANATLVLAVGHLALHARWLARVAGRLTQPRPPARSANQPVATPVASAAPAVASITLPAGKDGSR